MRPLISPAEAERRLRLIFPRGGFDSAASGPLAGWAIAAMIYVGAVADDDPTVWARPSTITWQRERVFAERGTDGERAAWRAAAARSAAALGRLLAAWGISDGPRYAENSREPLRDDTLRLWSELGVVRQRAGVATSSSHPRWALEPHFAELFDPGLTGDDLDDNIDAWTETHLDAGARLKVTMANRAANSKHKIRVTLPDGSVRPLEPGTSSLILKGIIEHWAPARLTHPVVLAISEPGTKVLFNDQLLLAQLGMTLDVANLLPDALIADLGAKPVSFWAIEAVATDGPITESRKAALQRWAAAQHIRVDALQFLTGFLSRNHPAAKKRLKDIASGTYAWFADEPDHELAWYAINVVGS